MSSLQPAQASVIEMTRALIQAAREGGVSRLRYVSPGGDECLELELTPARLLVDDKRHPDGYEAPQNIPRHEDQILALDDRTPEQKKADYDREQDALLFEAVGVVPEVPGYP